jgi:hypothetical protein
MKGLYSNLGIEDLYILKVFSMSTVILISVHKLNEFAKYMFLVFYTEKLCWINQQNLQLHTNDKSYFNLYLPYQIKFSHIFHMITLKQYFLERINALQMQNVKV